VPSTWAFRSIAAVYDIGLVIAKAVQGLLAAGVKTSDVVRRVALFGALNRDGWGVGLTILTALANLLPALPEEEAYLALFHGARRVAQDCDGQAPRRERAALGSRPEPKTLERWLARWTRVHDLDFRRGRPLPIRLRAQSAAQNDHERAILLWRCTLRSQEVFVRPRALRNVGERLASPLV
jgi:hypothetical protein